jgi:hypothetical protein
MTIHQRLERCQEWLESLLPRGCEDLLDDIIKKGSFLFRILDICMTNPAFVQIELNGDDSKKHELFRAIASKLTEIGRAHV